MPENEVGDLIITIRATAENLEQAAEEAKERLRGIGTAADQTKKPLKDAGQAGKDAGRNIKAGAQEAQLAWLALATVAVTVFRKIGEAVNQGIRDANAYKDALRGLGSVAESAGIANSAIEQATAKVTDQFFNATAAATAYKNLLLRGFSLDEATDTIIRLKDAAAFGRQASLSLSDAVTSATEGLKNENSILVDNAGVTKNVAKMWEEYAKSIGVSVSALTQQQKVEAEYQGIQKETAAMTGDIAKLQDSLSGKMAKTENQTYLLSKAFGDANTPMKALGTDIKNVLLEGLTGLVETFPGVTAGATTATMAFLGMASISKIIALYQKFNAVIKATAAGLGPLGIAALAVGALTAAYSAYQNHLEKVREEEEKRVQQNREAVQAQQEHIDKLEDMIARYVELQRKQSLTYNEALELKALETKLSEQYGITRDALVQVTEATGNYAAAVRDLSEAEREKLLQALEVQASDSYDKARAGMDALDAKKSYLGGVSEADLLHPESDFKLQEYNQSIAAAFADYQKWMSDQLVLYEALIEKQGGQFNADVSQILMDSLIPQIDPNSFESSGAFDDYFAQVVEKIGTLASRPEINNAVETMQEFNEKITKGLMPSDAEIITAKEAWNDLLGVDSPINVYLAGLVEDGKLSADVFSGIMLSIGKSADTLNLIAPSFDDTKAGITAYIAAAKEAAWATDDLAASAQVLTAEQQAAKEKYDSLATGIKEYKAALSEGEKDAEAIATWRKLDSQIDTMTKGSAEFRKAQEDMAKAANELDLKLDTTFGKFDESRRRVGEDIDQKAAELMDAADTWEETRKNLMADLNDILALGPGVLTESVMSDLIEQYKGLAKSEDQTEGLAAFADLFDGYREKFSSELEKFKEDITDQVGGSWSDELADGLSLAMRYALSNIGVEDEELGADIVSKLLDLIAAAASDADMSGAMETITAFTESIRAGIMPTDDDVDEFMAAWETMLGEDSLLITGLEALVESGDFTAEQMEVLKAVIESMLDPMRLLGDTAEETAERAADSASLYGDAADEMSDAADEMSDAEKALSDYQKTMTGVQKDLKSTSAMAQNIKQWKDLYKAYKDAKDGGKDYSGTVKDMIPHIKKMTGSLDSDEAAIEATNDAFSRLATYIPQRIAELDTQIASLEQQLWALDATDPHVDMTGDAAQLIAAILAAKAEAEALKALLDALGIYKGGGGGGGGKSSGGGGGGGGAVEKSAYEKEIEHLEHLKALDQLTYEQELANLENIAARRIADAEERLDLEERIYDVKKSIMERDAENLTDLSEAIMDALEARYEKMRDAETEALDQSREAWEEWRDHNVSAIEEQIAALDALEEAEDNQADREEHLRKIAMLEQSLAYEQDTYNQMQLQKQLDAANEDYAQWQREAARDEQKAALEAQIDAINEKADSEIDALDEQQKAIDSYYDERTTQANLQAEAELELMNSTQQKIIDLLGEYAPDYDAAGRSLGEKFMDGFTSVFGTFNDWFADFEADVTAAVDSIQAANVAAAAAAARAQTYDENGNPVSGITIEQVNNFNTPVETPAETVRRIQQANEDLAAQIAGE